MPATDPPQLYVYCLQTQSEQIWLGVKGSTWTDDAQNIKAHKAVLSVSYEWFDIFWECEEGFEVVRNMLWLPSKYVIMSSWISSQQNLNKN